MYTIAFFSATGNTEFLAHKLQDKINTDTLINISYIEPKTIEKNEHLIIMFPIYGFNAPKEVVEFAKNIPSSSFKKVSVIGVGCNESSLNNSASRKIISILQNKNFYILVNTTIAMPLSFFKSFGDDKNKEIIQNATKKIDFLGINIKNNIKVQNNTPLNSKIISSIGSIEKHGAKLFGKELHVNNKCTSCGICWNNCPANNIYNKRNKPKFKLNCNMCMKCIYKCPQGAISPRFSKFLVLKQGYDINHYTK